MSKKGMVLTTDILKDACILILHNIGVHSGAGVWVSSLDMILSLPYNEAVPWEKCDVCAITVPSSPTYCRQHGVYKLDSQGFVEDILFQETLENMEKCERKDGTVAMVCGMVYFSPQVSETLLSFFTKPPLDACTYFGLDSGEPTIKLSLFFDVMLPMCSGVNAREFRSGARSGSYGKDVAVSDIKTMRAARTILWEDLHKFKIKACMLEEGTCVFPRTIQEHKRNILERSMETCFPEGQLIWNNITHSHIKNQANVDPSSVIINSLLHENVSVGTKCVISHSHIQGDVIVAKDSVITGLVTGPEETDDQTIETALLFPVFHAIERVGLTEILWLQGVIQDSDDKHILRRWKSSWRLSLRDIQKLIDFEKEFNARRELFYTVGEFDLKRALLNQENKGFRAFYNSAVVEGYTQHVLGVLDEVCEMSLDELQAGTAARTLANIADKHNIHHGIDQLKHERGQWLDRPDKLIRAARHYEGAAQILIRHAVMTAKQHVTLTDAQPTGLGHWVLAECPARIDISGGWSDTPPITYEHGGAVTMAALLVNGKLVLVLHGSTEAKEVVCTELSDLSDYYQPHSPGALLKAAFVCAELVDLTSDKSLTDQLTARYGGGFELHSWTNLPQGSGLGTSSILAGAVMASLLKTAGKSCDLHSLVHMDQVGGLMGGVRLGVSEAGLPLKVDAHDLDLGPEVVQAFNDRLVLIYTGKTRLARNLLQDVVRNWYARNPQIVETEDRLVSQAHDCAKFFQQACLDTEGMVVTVIEEDGPSEPISEGDEDMSTYYNQPETLLDDDHAPSLPGDVDMVSLVANLSAGLAQGMGTEEGGTQKSGTDGEELKGEGSKDAEIKGEGVEKKGEDVGTEDVVGGPSTAGCGDMGSVNISNKTSIGSGDNNDASQTVAPTGSGESEKVPTCQTSSAEERLHFLHLSEAMLNGIYVQQHLMGSFWIFNTKNKFSKLKTQSHIQNYAAIFNLISVNYNLLCVQVVVLFIFVN
ncbi:FCSK-like protein, partial [Mya arenaria]